MRYREFLAAILLMIFPVIAGAATGPEITVDKTSHDFGDIREGVVARTQFSVTNTGDSLLEINDVKTTCGCTGAVHGEKKIPPGQKTEITVSYDSSGLSAGRKTQSVIIHSNDPNNPALKLQVFANVVHEVSIDPSTIVSKFPRFKEHVSFVITAKNSTQKPVTFDMERFQGGISKAVMEPEKVVVQPNSETPFKVEMDLVKPKQGNILTGSVSIRTDHPTVSQLPLKFLFRIEQLD